MATISPYSKTSAILQRREESRNVIVDGFADTYRFHSKFVQFVHDLENSSCFEQRCVYGAKSSTRPLTNFPWRHTASIQTGSSADEG